MHDPKNEKCIRNKCRASGCCVDESSGLECPCSCSQRYHNQGNWKCPLTRFNDDLVRFRITEVTLSAVPPCECPQRYNVDAEAIKDTEFQVTVDVSNEKKCRCVELTGTADEHGHFASCPLSSPTPDVTKIAEIRIFLNSGDKRTKDLKMVIAHLENMVSSLKEDFDKDWTQKVLDVYPLDYTP